MLCLRNAFQSDWRFWFEETQTRLKRNRVRITNRRATVNDRSLGRVSFCQLNPLFELKWEGWWRMSWVRRLTVDLNGYALTNGAYAKHWFYGIDMVAHHLPKSTWRIFLCLDYENSLWKREYWWIRGLITFNKSN